MNSETPRDAHRRAAGQQGGDRLAAAGVGDVVDVGRVLVERLGDQAGQDLLGASGGAARPGHGAEVRLHRVDQVVDVLDVGVGRDHDHLVLRDQLGDRRDLVEGDVGVVGGDRADHDQPHHHQLVGLPLELGELAEPDRAARAADVVDLGAPDESCSAPCIARAVPSQPPPGSAGAMIFSCLSPSASSSRLRRRRG